MIIGGKQKSDLNASVNTKILTEVSVGEIYCIFGFTLTTGGKEMQDTCT